MPDLRASSSSGAGPSGTHERYRASCLRAVDVDGIVSSFRIPASWLPRPARLEERISSVEGGYMAIHLESLSAGLRVPPSSFAVEFLREEIATIPQLHPHVWGALTGFFVLCHLRGVTPSTSLFRCFFRTRATRGNREFLSIQTTLSQAKLFSDPPPPKLDYESQWFVVRPPPYWRPEGFTRFWRTTAHREAVPKWPRVSILARQHKEDIRKLASGGPVELKTLLVDELLIAAGWFTLTDEWASSRHPSGTAIPDAPQGASPSQAGHRPAPPSGISDEEPNLEGDPDAAGSEEDAHEGSTDPEGACLPFLLLFTFASCRDFLFSEYTYRLFSFSPLQRWMLSFA